MSQFDDFNARVERTKVKAEQQAKEGQARRGTAHRDGDLGFRWAFLEGVLTVFGELFSGLFAYFIMAGVVVLGIAAFLGVSLKLAFGIAVVAFVAVLALAAGA